MIALHAHWRPSESAGAHGRVLVWAEHDDGLSVATNAKLRPHPGCLSEAALRDTLVQLGLGTLRGQLEPASLWLPSTRQRPEVSPQLPKLASKAKRTLRRWQVQGLALELPEAAPLLLRLSSNKGLFGVELGTDLRFWQAVALLVLEALAKHRYIPTLVTEDTYYARWLPVFDGPGDGPRLARLQAAMPPVCLAGADDPSKPSSPKALLKSFVADMSDALVRHWCESPVLPEAASADTAYRWISALFGPDAKVTGSAAQLERFAHSYQSWLRNLYVAGDERFRVALRLEEPPEKGTRWSLHFLLQARDDPSLLLPASELWRGHKGLLSKLGSRFEGAAERLLAGLGYAARHFAPIRKALHKAKPAKVTLSVDEAFSFLREGAPLLEASGFGVLIPPWWTRPSARLGVRVRLSRGAPGEGVAAGMMSLRNLVQYRWELALGDTPLGEDEFEALVALKSPLVRLRGEWVRLDPEQVEAALHFFETRAQQREMDLLEALQLGLSRDETVEGLPVDKVSFEGELASWLERLTGQQRLERLAQPKTLQAKLRPYQHLGFSWLSFMQRLGLGACLADDMGLGKTIQTLTLLLDAKERGASKDPVLLICPTSVVTNWQQECQRFAPSLQILLHQGSERLQGKAFKKELKKTDLVLTSYSLVRRDAAMLQDVSWRGIILDEAQNIKNPQSQQAKTIFGLDGQFRLALTGTPVENRLSELWSIMNFLNPGYLGSRRTFKQRFASKIERDKDEAALQSLRNLTSPFILRRLKTDKKVIQDLPEKTETKVFCYLSEEQASLYETVVRDALGEIEGSEGIERKGLVLSMMMRLKQICNHPAQYLHEAESYRAEGEDRRSGKLERLVALLEETVSVADRSLIFTQFTEMGSILERYLPRRLGVNAQFLHGGTSTKKRAEMVRRFQEDEDGPAFFILSLKAGGTGLNLTRANHVFHVDRWWNPAVENQATDRAFRIGQQRNVQVHKFVCMGTLEERIDAMIEAKKVMAEQLIETGEGWLTELSTLDLRDAVSLRREVL